MSVSYTHLDVYKRQPYGQAASTGDLVQPVQWSAEMHDDDLALVYYNDRYYNPRDGRWINRDVYKRQYLTTTKPGAVTTAAPEFKAAEDEVKERINKLVQFHDQVVEPGKRNLFRKATVMQFTLNDSQGQSL